MPSIQNAFNWESNQCLNNHNNLGYSLDWRNQQTINGITYYDCSSFQWYGLLNGGFDVTGAYLTAMGYSYSGNAITTGYMATGNNGRPGWLIALGFTEVDINGQWQPGDIVWRGAGYLGHRYGHCEMVYSGGIGSGITMGAHGDADDGFPAGSQVTINDYVSYASSYEKLFRYGETPPEPPTPTERHKMPLMFYLRPIWRY